MLEKYGIDNLDDFIKEYSSRNIKLANDNYDLEQELAELQKQLEEKERLLQYGKTEIKKLHKRINDIVKRDEKLFKSQPAEIVENIKKKIEKEKDKNDLAWLGFNKLDRILKEILKEYQK